MADWKQIQARIHRARAGADPAGQLEKLFEKTHDAMAAFELARHLEGAGRSAEAARWYATAAERFRRADWKKKAEEAAARLNGGVAPITAEAGTPGFIPPAILEEERMPAKTAPEESVPEATTRAEAQSPEQSVAGASAEAVTRRGGRRRGRRGGRHRRRLHEAAPAIPRAPAEGGIPAAPPAGAPVEAQIPIAAPRKRELSEPARPAIGEVISPELRGRFGDPALSSRLAQLEMQLRRLLACPPASIEHAASAPAGPGVFLVSDSDQITNYYAEACATLRIGIANVLRSSASRRTEEPLKTRFADHLGIPEARVAKYLKDHCFVRWLQLDEGANLFAHFTIAILRPALND
jgi:hypothetical protein